jgi:heat shock protein HtpX
MPSPRQQHWADDRGLEARMASTLLLLGLTYAGLVTAIVLAGVSAVVVFAIAALFAALQLTLSDRAALKALKAREATPARDPAAHAALDRVCMQMDMPKPRLAIADSEVANALAVGRSRKSATVCVTARAVRILEPRELEAVFAHELAHIQNRDAVVMTIASFFSLVAALVLRFGAQLGHAAVRLVAIAVAVAAYVISFVLLRGLSRYRELAADRSAALATGSPSALASALLKLDDAAARTPKKDLRRAQPVAVLCITGAPARNRFAKLVATHPSTEQRVAALERLERRLQGTAV